VLGGFGSLRGGINTITQDIERDMTGVIGRAGDMASAFGPLGIAVAGVAGGVVAFGGALFGLAKTAADAGDRLYEMHVKTGFSVETLSALDVAAKLNKTSLESLSAGLVIFDKNVEAANEGGKKQSAVFKQLQIDYSNNETALAGAFTRLNSITDAGQRSAEAVKLFGRGGAEMLKIIQESHGDLDAYKQKLADIGVLMTTDEARAAHQFSRDLELLENRFASFVRHAGDALIPELNRDIDSIGTMLGVNVHDWESWENKVVGTIAGVRAVLAGLSAVNPWQHPINSFLDWGSTNAGGAVADRFSKAADTSFQASMQAYLKARQEAQAADAAESSGRDKNLKDRGRGGGARKGKDEEQRREIEQLRLFNKELEDVTRTNREILEREYRLGLKDLDEYVEQARADNEKHYQDQLRGFTREEEIAQAHVKNAKDLQLKLSAIQLERDNAKDARDKENQRLGDERIIKQQARALALEKQLADIRESQREGERARIEESQREGYLSESTAQMSLLDLLRQGFSDRRILLEAELKQRFLTVDKQTEINNQLIKLDQDRANAVESAEDRIIDALAREATARLNTGGRVGGEQKKDEQGNILLTPEEIKKVNEEAGPDPVPDFSAHMHAIDSFKNFATSAFRGISQGFGSMIQAFLSGGDLSGKAFLQMAKGVIAGIAAQATVKAIFEVAEGYAALANPFTAWTAPFHFASAKFYGVVAAMAAGAALAIPGGNNRTGAASSGSVAAGSFSSGTSGGSATRGGTSSSNDPIVITEERRQAAVAAPPPAVQKEVQVIIVQHKHTVEPPPGWTVRELVKDADNNGDVRKLILSLTGTPIL
jgi:hypothetical protein